MSHSESARLETPPASAAIVGLLCCLQIVTWDLLLIPAVVLAWTGFALVCWLASGARLSMLYLALILPTLIACLLGVIGSVGHGYKMYDIGRDLWYVGKTLTFAGVGFWAGMYLSPRNAVRTISLAGVICAVVYLVRLTLFVSKNGFSLDNIQLHRQLGELQGSPIVAYGLGALFCAYRAGLRPFNSPVVTLFVYSTLTATVVASLSRSLMMGLIVFVGGAIGLYDRKWRMVFVPVLAATLGLLLWAMLREGDSSLRTASTFSDKIVFALDEIGMSDFEGGKNIGDRWRGYEAFQVWSRYLDEGLVGRLIGTGFGTVVRMPVPLRTEHETFYELAVFHNGYAYILIKIGLVGILLYLLQLLQWFRLADRIDTADPGGVALRIIVCALVVDSVLCTFTVGGLYGRGGYAIHSTLVALCISSAYRFTSPLQDDEQDGDDELESDISTAEPHS